MTIQEATPKTLAEALADLQTQLPRITKDRTAKIEKKTGGYFEYDYSDLAQISAELLPVLGKLGLSFTTLPTIIDGRFVLEYELLHVSGQSKKGIFPLPERAGPQDIGSALTYARRQCLCAVTGVAPDRDDDDASKAQRATSRRQRRTASAADNGDTANGDGKPGRGESLITADQQRDMQMLYRELGITDRAKKLEYAVGVVKHPLQSSAELTRGEANAVLVKLRRQHEKQREAATEKAAAGTAPADGPDGWPEAARPADAVPAGGAA